jgi:hypothetical protein
VPNHREGSLNIAGDLGALPLPDERLWVRAPRRPLAPAFVLVGVTLGLLLIAVSLPLAARLRGDGMERSGVGAAPTAATGDAVALAACTGKLGNAQLAGAFTSTAAVVADWTENVGYPEAPSAKSPWRAYPADAPAYVCYFDGSFPVTLDPPGPGATNAPMPDRAVIFVDANGRTVAPAKFGSSKVIPLSPPGGRF